MVSHLHQNLWRQFLAGVIDSLRISQSDFCRIQRNRLQSHRENCLDIRVAGVINIGDIVQRIVCHNLYTVHLRIAPIRGTLQRRLQVQLPAGILRRFQRTAAGQITAGHGCLF